MRLLSDVGEHAGGEHCGMAALMGWVAGSDASCTVGAAMCMRRLAVRGMGHASAYHPHRDEFS